MMTFEEYRALGYNAVDEAAFPRFSRMAEQTVKAHTFGRVGGSELTETNKIGVCELIDLFAANDGGGGRAVSRFANGSYSESYEKTPALEAQTADVIWKFFTAAQLWRGIDA